MIGLIAMAVGTGISMLSQYQQGKAADAMGKYNAAVAKQQAEAEATAIEAEMGHRADEDRAMMSAVRAKGGGRGIDYESGSPMLVSAQIARENQYDQLEMQRQANITRTHGKAQADMLTWEGKSAKQASLLKMAATGIKGAGSMYAMGSGTPNVPKTNSMPSRVNLAASLGAN